LSLFALPFSKVFQPPRVAAAPKTAFQRILTHSPPPGFTRSLFESPVTLTGLIFSILSAGEWTNAEMVPGQVPFFFPSPPPFPGYLFDWSSLFVTPPSRNIFLFPPPKIEILGFSFYPGRPFLLPLHSCILFSPGIELRFPGIAKSSSILLHRDGALHRVFLYAFQALVVVPIVRWSGLRPPAFLRIQELFLMRPLTVYP